MLAKSGVTITNGDRVPETTFDVIVIGAGPTGENVADRAVKGGLTAAIVESNLVGGECSYYACIPSKVLLRSAAAVQEARRVDGAKQAITSAVDASAVLARRTKFTESWKDDSQVDWLKGAKVTLLRGRGHLAGERMVEVSATDGSVTRLTARQAVVICTGTSPMAPAIPGLAEASPWTNREATRTERIPSRLAVLGGGPVGCELAQAFHSLGTKEVTIIDRDDRLLQRYEPFVGEKIAGTFRELGISVHTSANVTRVQRRSPGGPVQLWFDGPNTPDNSIEANEVLVATGRVPNTKDIGLETVSLKPGEWLEVDDTCRVKGVPSGWLYAAGDVNHRILLTHMGKYQARACGDAIVARAKGELDGSPKPWSRWAATADHAAVPQVVFTDPEAAAVGLTEAQANHAGLRVRAVEYDMSHISGAKIVADGYQGHAKMIVDEDRRVMVGATLVGQDVGELIHAFTVAVVGEVPLDRLWHAVPSFPTMSEIWLRLLESYGL
jgi:pyruvate/2-oxoglutarate dehydrogenase complex dihydrolipoamide dehydrogenase (E3) component